VRRLAASGALDAANMYCGLWPGNVANRHAVVSQERYVHRAAVGKSIDDQHPSREICARSHKRLR
jgi:hypothetical protein